MYVTTKLEHSSCVRSSTRSFATTFARLAQAPRKGSDRDKAKAAKQKMKLQRKKHPYYKQYNLREAERFALCDAMRFVLQDPHSDQDR